MQTFLPSYDLEEVGQILDETRIWKQVLEAKQIYKAISDPTYGWQSHPAVNMWRESPHGLLAYAVTIAEACLERGFNIREHYNQLLEWIEPSEIRMPSWYGCERVAASHRSNLLRKLPSYYSKFGWTENPADDYFWPV